MPVSLIYIMSAAQQSERLVQDASVSVWQRTQEQLSYTMLGLHKLVPPPSRINNNATLSLLCIAAAPWQQGAADPPGRPIVLPLDGPRSLNLNASARLSSSGAISQGSWLLATYDNA